MICYFDFEFFGKDVRKFLLDFFKYICDFFFVVGQSDVYWVVFICNDDFFGKEWFYDVFFKVYSCYCIRWCNFFGEC